MIPGQAPANVRLAPNSGHKWLWLGMSAYDPKRALTAVDANMNKRRFCKFERVRKPMLLVHWHSHI